MGTEMDWNGLQWVPKRTGTDFSLDRNELKWEQEKVGWGTIGAILIKLCMYCYEGCSGSLWYSVIKCSNIDIFLSCFDISQVDIIELASRS